MSLDLLMPAGRHCPWAACYRPIAVLCKISLYAGFSLVYIHTVFLSSRSFLAVSDVKVVNHNKVFRRNDGCSFRARFI